MKSQLIAIIISSAVLATTSNAWAHVGVVSGPGLVNKTQLITFGVGHGCNAGADDTYTITIDIPVGVTSVRPLAGDFGTITVNKDGAGTVTSVTFQKSDADLADSDSNYYELGVRMKLPNTPFTQVFFPVHQTCKSKTGVLTQVEWTALPGQSGQPAAVLTLLPAHQPGWNQYTLTEHIADPSLFFADAVIVWRGNQAYSSNPATRALIAATPSVSEITDGLHAEQTIWVKY